MTEYFACKFFSDNILRAPTPGIAAQLASNQYFADLGVKNVRTPQLASHPFRASSGNTEGARSIRADWGRDEVPL